MLLRIFNHQELGYIYFYFLINRNMKVLLFAAKSTVCPLRFNNWKLDQARPLEAKNAAV